MAEVSVAEVDQAEAKLLDLKAKSQSKKTDSKARARYKEQCQEVREVRRRYREQEEKAGRRGIVGGDAKESN